jgi:tetratricopeptide (TPR) repeat protein
MNPTPFKTRGAKRRGLPRFAPLLPLLALCCCFSSATAQEVSPPAPERARSEAVAYIEWFERGARHFDAGRYEEALEAFLRAVQANPEDVEVLYNVGVVYGKLGRGEESIAAYRLATGLRPKYAKAHARLCTALVDLGRYPEGLESCGRAIRLDREDSGLYYQLGRAFKGVGQYDQAAEALRRSVRLKPVFAEAHLELGLAYHALGEYRDSLDSLERAVRLGRAAPEAVRAYAKVSAEVEALDRELGSVEGYERALSLGHAYRLKGWFARAVAVYRHAGRVRPREAAPHYFEGLAHYGAGQYRRAAEAYRRARKLDPAMPEAKQALDWVERYLRNRTEGEATALSRVR